jgi:hypothetical protein
LENIALIENLESTKSTVDDITEKAKLAKETEVRRHSRIALA